MLTDVERIGAFGDAERTFLMTEESFRAFYEQTSRPVWAYLARITGDARLADDLLQEAYYRFLRTRADFESDDHRRNYLFRIATNLVGIIAAAAGHEERHLRDEQRPRTSQRVARRRSRRAAARSGSRDGADEATRAFAALARLRAGMLPRRDRRGARPQEGQPEVAALPGKEAAARLPRARPKCGRPSMTVPACPTRTGCDHGDGLAGRWPDRCDESTSAHVCAVRDLQGTRRSRGPAACRSR